MLTYWSKNYHYIHLFGGWCIWWVWTYYYINMFRWMSHPVGVNLPLYPHVSLNVALGGCEPTTIGTYFSWCCTQWVCVPTTIPTLSLDVTFGECEPTTIATCFAYHTRRVWTYHYIHRFRWKSHLVSVNLPLYPHISVDFTYSICEPTTISRCFD